MGSLYSFDHAVNDDECDDDDDNNVDYDDQNSSKKFQVISLICRSCNSVQEMQGLASALQVD